MVGDADELNVLVVDDDPTVLRLLSEIVRREGHQTVGAKSAEEILSLLPYWTFQVAYIDHFLPGMEGLMLGEYLRRSNPDMTIALVTGDPTEALARRTEEIGLRYIAKPFTRQQILEVIDAYHAAAAEREQLRLQMADEHFAPPLAEYIDDLTEHFSMPNVPARLQARLGEVIKRALGNLRSSHRYNERERVIALCGLLAAKVLGVSLPRASGQSLFELYDAVMQEQRRRREFSG